MSPILLPFVFVVGGTIAAAIWTVVIGLAGIPGALFTESSMKRTGRSLIPTSGLIITVIGQTFATLVFAAFVVASTRSLLGGSQGFVGLLVWIAAWWIATAPIWMALKDSAGAEVKNVHHLATVFTAPLTHLGFFAFLFLPGIMEFGWGWVPHL